jgi:hypothetical protein
MNGIQTIQDVSLESRNTVTDSEFFVVGRSGMLTTLCLLITNFSMSIHITIENYVELTRSKLVKLSAHKNMPSRGALNHFHAVPYNCSPNFRIHLLIRGLTQF